MIAKQPWIRQIGQHNLWIDIGYFMIDTGHICCTNSIVVFQKFGHRARLECVRFPKSIFFHKLFRERAKAEEERSKVCGNEQAGLQKLGRCHRYTLRFIVSSGSLPFPAPSSPSGPPSELFRSFRPKSVLRGAGRQGSPAGHQKLVSSNRHDLCCALRWAIVARLAPCAPPPSFCDENRLRKPF